MCRNMDRLAFQILFFLRVVQIVGIAIVVHNTGHLIFFHVILRQDIPQGLIVVSLTSVIAALESYISSASALHRRDAQPNYSSLFKAAGISTFISIYGYRSVRNVPYIRVFCEGNNFASLQENVEKHFCALVCNLIVFGAIMVIFTALVAVFAAAGLAHKRRAGCDRPECGISDDEGGVIPGLNEKM